MNFLLRNFQKTDSTGGNSDGAKGTALRFAGGLHQDPDFVADIDRLTVGAVRGRRTRENASEIHPIKRFRNGGGVGGATPESDGIARPNLSSRSGLDDFFGFLRFI